MNIKKIIKESLDNDWSWAQFDPIEPRKKGDIMVGDTYTVYGSNYSVRYVLEIFEVTDDEVIYKILVTSDEEDEPVGSIQSTELDHAKRLITRDNHWVLTDYHGKGLVDIKESEKDDFDWLKEDPYITIDEAIKNGLIGEGDKIWVKGYTKISSWDSDEKAVYIDGWFIIDSLGSSLTSTNYKRASKEICDVLECGSEGQFLDEDKDLVIYKIEKSNTQLTESTDFDWIKEINPVVTLKPDTLYYFEPPLTPDEVENFAYMIPNSNYIQEWLLGRIPELMRKYGNGNEGIKYFVTGRDVNNKVAGWCTETPIGRARLSYYNSGFVNARKEFNL